MRRLATLVAVSLLLAGCGESASKSAPTSSAPVVLDTPTVAASAAPIVSLTGDVQKTEQVDAPFDIALHVSNAGGGVRDVALDLSFCASDWVAQSLFEDGLSIPGETNSYDLGPLPANGAIDAILTLSPSNTGSHTCTLRVYPGDGLGGGYGQPLATESTTVDISS